MSREQKHQDLKQLPIAHCPQPTAVQPRNGVSGRTLARVSVTGIVQGVGFRPFVFRVANELRLAGWVANTSGSVEIEVEGDDQTIQGLLDTLENEAPPQARIKTLSVTYGPEKGYAGFKIRHSRSEEGGYQLVSPDIATCADCRAELFDPEDRRYRYPFTNCTNCGPRFTIIEDIPYDRPLTTMKVFDMCPDCRREYDDPLDRRFHAQPNACPVCGPALELADSSGRRQECSDVIREAAALLRKGRILAIKGLGGFHLACDATDAEAVNRLRERKGRRSKPFAVMLRNLVEVREHCEVSDAEAELLQSSQCPIVVLRWQHLRPPASPPSLKLRRAFGGLKPRIDPGVAPNLCYMGIMLPYTPLHHLLLDEAGRPLVMTSGNLSEEPIAKDNDEALDRLGRMADGFVFHNREILSRYDDSVFVVEPEPVPLRRARGYAPYPISLPEGGRQVLACGAHEKNTFCMTRENYAFLSQHIGDMENEQTCEHFATTIDLYKKLFRIEPEIVAYDMHPEYLSTQYALNLVEEIGLTGVPVQHHHAHIVSCLVDNARPGPVIGVAFDGAGYGPDRSIWGGEFLVADQRGYERAGHLEYVPLPGGAAAIRRPYRMAFSYLHTLFPDGYPVDRIHLRDMPDAERRIVIQQMEKGINCPPTSSAGRLFDAVSALAGIRGVAHYEAQAAVELEMKAHEAFKGFPLEPYPFSVDEGEMQVVRLRSLVAGVAEDVAAGVSTAATALRFHSTMACMIGAVCGSISARTGLRTVALSGGCFQNRLLVSLTVPLLEQAGFEVLTHRRVPCNDGAIALGQAVVARRLSNAEL